MIYSCTTFLNEFDLLDLKISEEYDYVDKIIVVESNRTFRNNPKELFLRDLSRYKDDKIEIISLEDRFVSEEERKDYVWFNEKLQRNAGTPSYINDEDIIFSSDVDEIINRKEFPRLFSLVEEKGLIKLAILHFIYKINLFSNDNWTAPFLVSGKYWNDRKNQRFSLQLIPAAPNGISFSWNDHLNLDFLRKLKDPKANIVRTNGFHFSYLNSPEKISYKIKNFAHTEYDRQDFTDETLIETRMKLGVEPFNATENGQIKRLKRVEIDDSFPLGILDNIVKWYNFIER